MLDSFQIDIPSDQIEAFCLRFHITELSVFGSVLHDDFSDNSDIDILVTFAENRIPTLFDIVEMSDELEIILGRKVDLLTRKSVENSDNYIRRKEILASAQVLYEA